MNRAVFSYTVMLLNEEFDMASQDDLDNFIKEELVVSEGLNNKLLKEESFISIEK